MRGIDLDASSRVFSSMFSEIHFNVFKILQFSLNKNYFSFVPETRWSSLSGEKGFTPTPLLKHTTRFCLPLLSWGVLGRQRGSRGWNGGFKTLLLLVGIWFLICDPGPWPRFPHFKLLSVATVNAPPAPPPARGEREGKLALSWSFLLHKETNSREGI